MKISRADKIRVFLVNRLYTSFYGMPIDEWIRMLRKHGFAVDAPYLPRAALMTLTSALTSLIRAYENRKYGPEIADVEVRRPLFILGHWRSGTTYLHNLLAQDEQFAYPNTWQALSPHTFLSTERYSTILRLAAPKTRLIDNVAFAPTVPWRTSSRHSAPCARRSSDGSFPGGPATTTGTSPSEPSLKTR
jgi:omega-hydroxy-beta-dihydromenaquinone-9 sulfotransferase